jgi:hypothetical protein
VAGFTAITCQRTATDLGGARGAAARRQRQAMP